MEIETLTTKRDAKLENEFAHASGHVLQAKPNTTQRSIYHGSMMVITFALPIIAFVIWIPLLVRKHDNPNVLTGNVIGGRLTQTQAKAVDFISGAVIGPIIMVICEYYWFSSAHVTTINEKGAEPVPLSVLGALSSTDRGTYNVLKLQPFVKAKRWRMTLFAFLMIFAAVAKTALSNVIAYEAYTTADGASTASLTKLNSTLWSFGNVPSQSLNSNPYSFNRAQQASFVGQTLGMLTSLSQENALEKLDGDSYIGVNATTNSMNTVDASVLELRNVPGYRLTASCSPLPTLNQTFSVTNMGFFAFYVTTILGFSNNTGGIYQAMLPGQTDQMESQTSENYTFVAWELEGREAILGFFGSFNLTGKAPLKTPYGDMEYLGHNNTGFQGQKSIMSTWGLRCGINRQQGHHNYTRDLGGSWKRKSSIYNDDDTEKNIRVSLADWQLPLNFHTPGSNGASAGHIPGIGPVFSQSASLCPDLESYGIGCTEVDLDYRAFVLNYLYAVGETNRIAFEVAAERNSSAPDSSQAFDVQVMGNQIFYHITYVPLILIAGLLGILFSACVVSALAFYSRHTSSYRTWREVTVLRLLADSIGLFKHDTLLEGRLDGDGKALGRWASNCHVKYAEIVGGDGNVAIRLTREQDLLETPVTATPVSVGTERGKKMF